MAAGTVPSRLGRPIASEFHDTEGESVRRLALASIIAATALLASGCSSTPEPEPSTSSPAPSVTPTPSSTPAPSSTPTPTPSPTAEPEFTAEQLRDICLDYIGDRAVLNPQGPNEVRTALRNDGTWFIEMSGDSPGNPSLPGYSLCVIGGTPDAPEPIANRTSGESTADPNYVDGLDYNNSI